MEPSGLHFRIGRRIEISNQRREQPRAIIGAELLNIVFDLGEDADRTDVSDAVLAGEFYVDISLVANDVTSLSAFASWLSLRRPSKQTPARQLRHQLHVRLAFFRLGEPPAIH